MIKKRAGIFDTPPVFFVVFLYVRMLVRNFLVSVVVILAVFFALVFLVSKDDQEPVVAVEPTVSSEITYVCSDSRVIHAVFFDNNTAEILLSDGRRFTLQGAVSASGTKYANENETLVFSTRTGGAFMQEGNTQTYTDCIDGATAEANGDVVLAGVITSIDREQIAVDGPTYITVEKEDETMFIVVVPSMGILMCEAQGEIADVFALEAGESIEVRGEINVDGFVLPCESSEHYLRIQEASL